MTIRLGIAGVRHPHIGSLFESIQRHSDIVTLVALAEDDAPLRAQYVSQCNAATRYYTDYHEMLAVEALDVVAVAAINDARGAIVCASLDAGAHVLTDKPLCTTLDDLNAIEAAWRRGDRHLGMMFEKRFWAPTEALSALLQSGELGNLALAWASGPHRLRRATRPAWMFDPARYGGILNDLAIHDIDLLLWLSGARAGQVQGFTGNLANRDVPEFANYGQVHLRTMDGLLATIEVHWLSPEAAPYHGDYRLVLTGTEGTAEARWTDNELRVTTHRAAPRLVPLSPPQSVVDDFLLAISRGAAPAIRTPEVLTATRVALLAQSTANSGEWHDWQVVQDRQIA